MLEISKNAYGDHNDRLVEKMQNGLNNSYRKFRESTAQINAMEKIGKVTTTPLFPYPCPLPPRSLTLFPFHFSEHMMKAGIVTPVKAPILTPKLNPPLSPLIEYTNETLAKKPKIVTLQIDPSRYCKDRGTYATSFLRQLIQLIMRSFLILTRDRSLTAKRITIHTCIAFLIGTLYFGIGNDAAMIFNNFRYIFLSIMFLMFTSFSSTSITCKCYYYTIDGSTDR